MMVRLIRNRERILSICLIWFPIWWIGRAQLIPWFGVFYNNWGFYLEGVWVWRIRWGASQEMMGMVLESSLLFFSIYRLCKDVSVFVVFSYVPKCSFLEFTYILLFKTWNEYSLTMLFPVLVFSNILVSRRCSECSLTMIFTILPFSYILSSIRKSVCPMSILFPILVFSNILVSFPFPFSKSECSLTMIFPILPFSYILPTIRVSLCSMTIYLAITYFTYIIVSIRPR